MIHITLITFREGLAPNAERGALQKLAQACPDVNVLKPFGAEAERSWHACIEVRGSVKETLTSTAWAALMAAVADRAVVYKAWTFAPMDQDDLNV